jgi:hypothetical protein
MPEPIFSLPVIDQFAAVGERLPLFVVAAPFDMTQDPPEIVGQRVQLDGRAYVVRKIDVRSPILAGSTIVLSVDEF